MFSQCGRSIPCHAGEGTGPDDEGPCAPHRPLGSRQPRRHCCVRWALTEAGAGGEGARRRVPTTSVPLTAAPR